MSDNCSKNIANSTAKFILQCCIMDLSQRIKPLIKKMSRKENGTNDVYFNHLLDNCVASLHPFQ